MSTSYRNQSVDLQSKSTDWFLYDGNIGREKVKIKKFSILTTAKVEFVIFERKNL